MAPPPFHLTTVPGCISPPNKSFLEPEIFHTTDGGKSWAKQALPQLAGCPIRALSFRNERDGVAAAASHLYYTSDGGTKWSSATFPKDCADPDQLPDEWNQQMSFFFYDAKVGWLGSLDGALLNTTDGGRTWCTLKGPERGDAGLGDFGALFFDSPKHGWILGAHMNVYETNDGGLSWAKVPGPESIYDLSCIAGRCWAVSDGKLYRTEQ